MGADHDQFIQSLEALGLDEVRTRLARDVYGNAGNRRSVAEDWVARKMQAAGAELLAEQIKIASRSVGEAKRAADATEWQAAAAEKATRIAIGAFVVSVIAAILSIIAIVRH